MNKQINLKDIRINNNSSDYFVSHIKDNEQQRKEFVESQKQVRYDVSSNTKEMPVEEVLGFKVEGANKRVVRINYETRTITIE